MKDLTEFNDRAADARKAEPSQDTFTQSACEWIKLAAFAGYDPKQVARRAVIRHANSTAIRINALTIRNIMDEMYAEQSPAA